MNPIGFTSLRRVSKLDNYGWERWDEKGFRTSLLGRCRDNFACFAATSNLFAAVSPRKSGRYTIERQAWHCISPRYKSSAYSVLS